MRLKNYYRVYRECPECGKKTIDNKIYFKCKDGDCGYVEKQYIRVKKKEKEERKIVEKMVKACLPVNTPRVNFPGSAYDSKVNAICAGWYIDPPIHTVNVPRKAFALPRKQLTDIVAHECGHADPEASEKDRKNADENTLKGWNDPVDHGPVWYDVYISNFNMLLANGEFSNFINEGCGNKYSLEEEIPNPISDYRLDPNDYTYDPNED